jgi:hypothetical protein
MGENLKPSVHCKKSASWAKTGTKNFHYRDRHIHMKLYMQYIRPKLEFASPAWNPWQQGEKNVLERVQEKAVKMVSGLKSNLSQEKCEELRLVTIEKRRLDQDLALTHKMLSNARFHGNGIWNSSERLEQRIGIGDRIWSKKSYGLEVKQFYWCAALVSK